MPITGLTNRQLGRGLGVQPPGAARSVSKAAISATVAAKDI